VSPERQKQKFLRNLFENFRGFLQRFIWPFISKADSVSMQDALIPILEEYQDDITLSLVYEAGNDLENAFEDFSLPSKQRQRFRRIFQKHLKRFILLMVAARQRTKQVIETEEFRRTLEYPDFDRLPDEAGNENDWP